MPGPLLLQVSDVHARTGQSFDGLANSVAASLEEQPEYLVACGDFADRGENHSRGFELVQLLGERLSLEPDRIVCCPGNHDLEGGELASYRRGAGSLLRDSDRAQAAPCSCHLTKDVSFLVVNTVFHLDHKVGLVDIDAVKESISTLPPSTWRVAVAHHHCISIGGNDSPIQNAYPFLQLLSAAGFDALLHGHRHFATSLTVGKGLKIFGVGSLSAQTSPETARQFNLIELGEKITRYRFAADTIAADGSSGSWVPSSEEW